MEQLMKNLKTLRLHGITDYLTTSPEIMTQDLSFEDKLEILTAHELLQKKNKKIARLLSLSKLKMNPILEKIEPSTDRGITRETLKSLLKLDFLEKKHNIVITGATGCGKTHLACSIGTKACTNGYSVKFEKLPNLLGVLQMNKELGSYNQIQSKLFQYDLLILDDFGLSVGFTATQLDDLFAIIDERHEVKSTIITSQLPTSKWHDYLNSTMMADAILDRVLSRCQKIELKGESLRWG